MDNTKELFGGEKKKAISVVFYSFSLLLLHSITKIGAELSSKQRLFSSQKGLNHS